MARGLLGAGHRLQMRHARKAALKQADLVLLAGVPCDFASTTASTSVARRSTSPPIAARRRWTATAGPTSPVRATPAGSCRRSARPYAARAVDRSAWVATLRAADDRRDAEIVGQASAPAEASETPTVSPLDVFHRLEQSLPHDSVLVADGGDFVATGSYILRPRGPLSWLDPGVFGTLGVGAGFALGAKLVRPDAEVWIAYGDGSVGYSLAEFDTFVRHKIPVIALVGNDASWAQIAREQVEILGDPIGTELRRTDYHTAAAGFGGVGIELREPERIDAVLAEARAAAKAGNPVLINAHLRRTDFRKGSISM
jgi:acetolactate synthase-1/2/3 large subunit